MQTYHQHKFFKRFYLTSKVNHLIEEKLTGFWLTTKIIAMQPEISFLYGEQLEDYQEWHLVFQGDRRIVKCFDQQGILKILFAEKRDEIDAEMGTNPEAIELILRTGEMAYNLKIIPEIGIDSIQPAPCYVIAFKRSIAGI